MRKAWANYIAPLLFAVAAVLATVMVSQTWAGEPVVDVDTLEVEQTMHGALQLDEIADAERLPEGPAVFTYNDSIAIAQASDQPPGGAGALRRSAVRPDATPADPRPPLADERLRAGSG